MSSRSNTLSSRSNRDGSEGRSIWRRLFRNVRRPSEDDGVPIRGPPPGRQARSRSKSSRTNNFRSLGSDRYRQTARSTDFSTMDRDRRQHGTQRDATHPTQVSPGTAETIRIVHFETQNVTVPGRPYRASNDALSLSQPDRRQGQAAEPARPTYTSPYRDSRPGLVAPPRLHERAIHPTQQFLHVPAQPAQAPESPYTSPYRDRRPDLVPPPPLQQRVVHPARRPLDVPAGAPASASQTTRTTQQARQGNGSRQTEHRPQTIGRPSIGLPRRPAPPLAVSVDQSTNYETMQQGDVSPVSPCETSPFTVSPRSPLRRR
ncbi:hypothetical protein S40293_06154 [Stachybotrys chartarum IBT 40293]|nr:hypothetical protein S40293_06154 [Stachybotrys chartarum IBT 40293]KFA78214.1 hypothetical protein S40288_10602 [Stachybotrys chartarum IBT 40288]